MPAVILSDISIAFGDRQVLQSVNFRVSSGDIVALAGANGSGKSTLMKIIAGVQAPDSGRVATEKQTRISYLPQSGVTHEGRTLLEEAERAYAWADGLIAERLKLEEQLGKVTEDSEQAQRLVLRHHELQERLSAGDYYSRREKIERVLLGLGFHHEDLTAPTSTFSGGWQMRIALARVLLEDPDILLLDEPTNYLDLEARDWLEDFLLHFHGGVLVVSHDRYFLDATVKAVAELYLSRLSVYPGNFTRYEKRREQELEEIAQRYRRQQEEIEHLETFIRRFRYNASKATLVQSRIRQLEKLERIEVPPAMKRIHFAFPAPPHSGRMALQLTGIGKSYGAHQVIRNLDLEVAAGEKLVLVGPNGAGKSTLMRLLAGEEAPDTGEIRYGHNVQIGYYAQDHAEKLEGSASVEETAESWAPTALIPHLRTLLGAFLFRDNEIRKPVSVLSGGEKSRLAVLRLLMKPANLLFLDEPTNHMDIASKDILLEALRHFAGTVVFVSHDRHFINGLATRVLELGGGPARMFAGDYQYYTWKKQQEAEAAGGGVVGGKVARPAEPAGRKSPATVPEEKAKKVNIRKLQREEEQIIQKLESLQAENQDLELDMTREEVYRDGERMREIKARLAEIAREEGALQQRWEEITAELADARP